MKTGNNCPGFPVDTAGYKGSRENCGTFSSIIPVTQNGTNFEVPKGGRGLESALLILMKGSGISF
jgi:hypothetical protein